MQKGYKTPKDLLLLTEEDCEEMKMEEVRATPYSHSVFIVARLMFNLKYRILHLTETRHRNTVTP